MLHPTGILIVGLSLYFYRLEKLILGVTIVICTWTYFALRERDAKRRKVLKREKRVNRFHEVVEAHLGE